MSENSEIDLSKLVGSSWAKNFHVFLSDLAPLGPATASKYAGVVHSLLGDRGIFSLDEAVKLIKRKNRVYVRAAIVKLLEYLAH